MLSKVVWVKGVTAWDNQPEAAKVSILYAEQQSELLFCFCFFFLLRILDELIMFPSSD